jgi:hypothetical protein
MPQIAPDREFSGTTEPHPLTFSAYQRVTAYNLPIISDNVPALHEALKAWENGDENLLFTRQFMLETAQISPLAIKYMYVWLLERNEPHYFTVHKPTITAEEKEGYLEETKQSIASRLDTEEEIYPVRTVTLHFSHSNRDQHLLVTAPAKSHFIEKGTKRAVATHLNYQNPNAAAKNTTINSPHREPTLWLGVMPGIIGPFISPSHQHATDGLFYLPLNTPQTAAIEIALSPMDSLFMRKTTFENLLKDYAQDLLSQTRLIELPHSL